MTGLFAVDPNLPSRATAAYRELKRRVIELELAPGAFFTEAELTASLGLSRTPVREALAQLRMEGLVMVEARAGYRVTPVTLKDVRELFDLRKLLEVKAVSLAVGRIDSYGQLQELEETGCGSAFDPEDQDSVAEFLRRNTEFHTGLAAIGGNARLAATLRHVLEQLERVMHLTLAEGIDVRPAEWVDEHHELLRAVIGGDEQEAARVALAQASAAQMRITEVLLSSEIITGANLGQLRDRGAGA